MAKIMLIGDSITEYMPYIYKGPIGNDGDEVEYHGRENIGVGSYMKYIWPHIKDKEVDAYVMLLGINNIRRPDCDYDNRETTEDLVSKMKEFIDVVHGTGKRLLVQSLYPTKYLVTNYNVLLVNEQIEKYCSDIGVEYIDIHNLLLGADGLIFKDYSDDGIHPNKEGYTLIARKLTKALNGNNKSYVKKDDN